MLRADQGLVPRTHGVMPEGREAKVRKGDNGDPVAPELSVRAGPRWGAGMRAQFCGSDAGTLPEPTVLRAGVSAEDGLISLFLCTGVRVVGLKVQDGEGFHWSFGRIHGSDRLSELGTQSQRRSPVSPGYSRVYWKFGVDFMLHIYQVCTQLIIFA